MICLAIWAAAPEALATVAAALSARAPTDQH